MSDDLISRPELIKKIFPYGMPDGGNYPINAKAVMDAIEKAPASGGLIGRKECSEYMAADNIEIEHFLEFEIMQTESWMREKCSSVFNGVLVGDSQAHELMRKHISFCKHLLRIIRKETK